MAGATITSDGGIALILNVPSLLSLCPSPLSARLRRITMAVKVLVVDDFGVLPPSGSAKSSIKILMTVIDTAQNGREAVDKAQQLRPDVITMDIEMPVLGRHQRRARDHGQRSDPILMFSP